MQSPVLHFAIRTGGITVEREGTLWRDRKRTIFGLPLSFTKYTLLNDKLLIETGLLTTREDEVRLYRIHDVTLRRTFGQKIFGIGTIHCCSSDKTQGDFDIKNVKQPREVKDLLSRVVEEERMRNRVYTRENFVDDSEDLNETHEEL